MNRTAVTFIVSVLAVLCVAMSVCLHAAGDSINTLNGRVRTLEGLVRNLEIDRSDDLAALQQLRGCVLDLDDHTVEIWQLQIQVADLMRKADRKP